jgi:dsDNA-specific endonuclease/ATPase MutS2
MNRHALDVLQYPEALAVIAGHASSPLGAEAVRALRPSVQLTDVRDELARVSQMSTFLFRAQDWQMPALPDARAALRRLAVSGSVLDGPELRDVAFVLRGSAATHRALDQHAVEHPLLAELGHRLTKTRGRGAPYPRGGR